MLVIIIFSLFLSQSSYAIDFVSTEDKFKNKIELMINEKKVKKKTKNITKTLQAIGLKGEKAAKFNIGGYCYKFGKEQQHYKNFKIIETILIFKSFENCYSNIESYRNAADNNFDEYYTFVTFYVYDKIRHADTAGLLSYNGVAKKLKKSNTTFKFLSHIDLKKNSTESIVFTPIALNEKNNLKAKEFLKDLYKLMEKVNNSELTESKAKKQLISKLLSDSTMIDYVSTIMTLVEEGEGDTLNSYKNQDYFYSCVKNKSSIGQSFNQFEGGYINSTEAIKELNLIDMKFQKPFDQFEFDELLNKIDFSDKISEIIDYCGNNDYTKFLLQTRN